MEVGPWEPWSWGGIGACHGGKSPRGWNRGGTSRACCVPLNSLEMAAVEDRRVVPTPRGFGSARRTRLGPKRPLTFPRTIPGD